MPEQFKTITLDVVDRLAIIKLSRPPLNIINLEMMDELLSALDEAREKAGIGVLVLRSGVDGVFSAGADVREHLPDKAEMLIKRFEQLIKAIIEFPRPVLCVVQGRCLGGGMELAMACDLVIASETAEFGQPEIRVGVYPPAAAALYPRMTALKHAAMLIFSGKIIKAEEALKLGLVNEVAPDAELEEHVKTVIDSLLSNSSIVLGYAKKALREALSLPLGDALRRSSEIYLEELMKHEDPVEGLRAFLEKRRPVWKGK